MLGLAALPPLQVFGYYSAEHPGLYLRPPDLPRWWKQRIRIGECSDTAANTAAADTQAHTGTAVLILRHQARRVRPQRLGDWHIGGWHASQDAQQCEQQRRRVR